MEVWIGRDGERHGPYKEEDVREWLRSGQLSRDDLGWYDGLADWQPLSVLFPDALRQEPPAFDPATPAAARTQLGTGTFSLEDHAGFWKRVAAYILDIIVLYLPGRLIESMLGGAAAQATLQQAQLAAGNDINLMVAAMSHYYEVMLPAMLLQTVMVWLYFALCESSVWQATPGKRMLGIRVTDLGGERISFLRATGRYFAKILSAMIFLIGFLMVAFTQRKQGLHDMLANTLVLNGRTRDAGRAAAPPGNDGGSFSA